jgi:signal transduction histidine kinase
MFRNAPIRTKLIATLIAPLLVLTTLALVGIRSNLAESTKAARVNEFAVFAGSLAPLVHELQGERSMSSSYLSSNRESGGPELAAKRREVDLAAAAYRVAAGRLDLPATDHALTERVAYGLRELANLPVQRRAIDSRPITAADLVVEPGIEKHEEEGEEHPSQGHGPIDTPGKALNQYTDTINDLLDINSGFAPTTDNAELLRAVAASVALSRAKDFTDAQHGLLNDVFTHHRFRSGQYGKLTSVAAAETIYLAQFESSASHAQHEMYERVMTGPEVARVNQLRELAVHSQDNRQIPADPRAWFSAMAVQLERLRGIEERLSGDVTEVSSRIKAAADRRALLYSFLLAAALALALVLALATARSLIRPLGRLRDAADVVAEQKLPSIVRRLQEGESVDLTAESAPPIQTRSRDEIGQLAESFNAVHRVAVQVAGKEAALRRGVGQMFLNLARRSQGLVSRQLELVGELHQKASDRELQAGLTELDHLATRMRRNAENLILLSGAESNRRWRGPIPLTEIVAAAATEVKEQNRVQLVRLEEAQVHGRAATDVVHLLAELIDNAISFSPPGTKVRVAGQALPGRYLLEIEDQGMGMTDEELIKANDRLDNPPVADFALAKMLGFVVVGHLATRRGIKVQLRHSWYGGITALVLLPAGVVTEPPGPDILLGQLTREDQARAAAVPGGAAPALPDHVPMVHMPLGRRPDR